MFHDTNVLISTGSKAEYLLNGCRGGWLEFNLKCWDEYDDYQVTLDHPGGSLTSTRKNQWDHKGRVSLFHDTKRKELKVAIRQLEQSDTGPYSCSHDSEELSSAGGQGVKVIIGKTCCFFFL